MEFRSSTIRVLREVELLSTYRVHVELDASLRTLATVRMAGGPLAFHLIRVNPTAVESIDYLAVYQCGFVLRQFTLPPADRFDISSSYRGRKDTDRLLAEHKPKGIALPKPVREQLKEQMLSGLITQLRSVPIGLRIDRWIAQQAPDLIDQQRHIAERQLNENVKALSPEVRSIAPSHILNANLSMNAAFAAYWSREWKDTRWTVPYTAKGMLAKGEALLSISDELSQEPVNDRELIDNWASALHVAGWYEYLPRIM